MTDLITRIGPVPVKRRQLTVKAITDLNPHLRRITLTGEDLQDFSSQGADDHVKVFFTLPDGELVGRDYTPRYFRPDALELDLDFVLHEGGIGSTWAAQAKPGDPILVGGPRGSTLVRYEFDAYLLVADDAALPALARRLEELPAGAKVTAFAEVQDAEHELPLPTKADLTLHWLHRGQAAAGTTTLLLDAVKGWPLPAGLTFAWIGAERSAAFAVRDDLTARGLDPDHLRATAYWTAKSED